MWRILRDLLRTNRAFAAGVVLLGIVLTVALLSFASPYPPNDAYVVPPDVPPRRVRIEALLKVGYWMVAPLEVRVIEPTVPNTRGLPVREDIAPIGARSSDTAQRQLLRYLDGLDPEMPPGILRVRDVIQRNAAEDMLVARALRVRGPELNLMSWWPYTFPDFGAEWYLRVRDFIYRYNQF